MKKRVRVSSNIKFKKYVLPCFLILFSYLITKYGNLNRFWDGFAWCLTILFSLLLISLKKVEYTKNHIYFNNKKFDYESIKGFKSFDINQNIYYVFITESNGLLGKYHLTQLGGLSYLSIFKMLLKKSNSNNVPLVEFLALLDEKSNIK